MIDWCLQVILCDNFDAMNYSFTNMAAKVAARLIQANPDIFNLPLVCGDYHLANNVDRVEKFLINWLLPLCFRLGTGRYGMYLQAAYCLCHLVFLTKNGRSYRIVFHLSRAGLRLAVNVTIKICILLLHEKAETCVSIVKVLFSSHTRQSMKHQITMER